MVNIGLLIPCLAHKALAIFLNDIHILFIRLTVHVKKTDLNVEFINLFNFSIRFCFIIRGEVNERYQTFFTLLERKVNLNMATPDVNSK